MAIQPNIALMYQPPRFESPFNMLAQISQIQQAQQANALNQMRMQQLEREMAREESLSNALRSGQPLTLAQALGGGTLGLNAFKAQQEQLKAQEERQLGQRRVAAEALLNTRPDLENVSRTYEALKGQGIDIGPQGAEMMLATPDERAMMMQRFITTTPGMPALMADRAKTEAETEREKALRDKARVEQRKIEAEISGTLPRGQQQQLAPNAQIILDAEGKPILVDITKYTGTAQLGAPGVIGRPADMRAPAPTTALIQDPSNPSRQLIINTREYTSGTVGSPGVIGVAGAQAVEARKETTQERARTDLNSSLETLESLYEELDKRKGLPSTERGAARNIASYVASTTPGQIVGQAVGTEEQSIRDQIAASRFVLVQQIKNATGMSAQQMNSNFELQQALNSLSDPKVGIEAAKKIIENLRNQYVQGGKTTRGVVGNEPQPATKGVAVSLPDGRIMTFPSQKAADDFKRAAGLGE